MACHVRRNKGIATPLWGLPRKSAKATSVAGSFRRRLHVKKPGLLPQTGLRWQRHLPKGHYGLRIGAAVAVAAVQVVLF